MSFLQVTRRMYFLPFLSARLSVLNRISVKPELPISGFLCRATHVGVGPRLWFIVFRHVGPERLVVHGLCRWSCSFLVVWSCLEWARVSCVASECVFLDFCMAKILWEFIPIFCHIQCLPRFRVWSWNLASVPSWLQSARRQLSDEI